nr:MAG TPA: hypothetical protein [Caudoviricetes sp.]
MPKGSREPYLGCLDYTAGKAKMSRGKNKMSAIDNAIKE